MKRRAARHTLFVTIAAATFALITVLASAQNKKKPSPTKATPRAKPTTTQTAPDAAVPLAPKAESAPPKQASDAGAANSNDKSNNVVVESKGGDGGTKVFKFGEMEIEGRLRNPQLVYFLRRVRAEFAAGDLGHRSFMQELSETKKEPSF